MELYMCVLHGDCKATGTMSDWLQLRPQVVR